MSYAIFILQQEKNAIISDLTNICLTLENETLSQNLLSVLKAEMKNYERQLEELDMAIVNLAL